MKYAIIVKGKPVLYDNLDLARLAAYRIGGASIWQAEDFDEGTLKPGSVPVERIP